MARPIYIMPLQVSEKKEKSIKWVWTCLFHDCSENCLGPNALNGLARSDKNKVRAGLAPCFSAS